MGIMKRCWGKTHIIGNIKDGKRVLVHQDGHINRQDLDKLTINELFLFSYKKCNGSLKSALIDFILSEPKIKA